MAETAGHVTMLQRSPSYIASAPAVDPLVRVIRRIVPGRWADLVIRWYKALTTQAFFQFSQHRPETVKKMLRRMLTRQLPAGYDIDTHFKPSYNPWDQRFCAVPDGDLFKAITAGRVEVVTDHIEALNETGIRLRSGRQLDADIIVAATGLDLLFLGGMQLAVDGQTVEVSERLTYKGMMLEGVPNLAVAVGYTNASWTLKCDLTCDYVCRLLNRMREQTMTKAVPVNRDGSVTPAPLLSLTSGYVLRAAERFPKQGSRHPWQVHQNYLKDYRVLKRSDVVDGALELSRPAVEPVVAAAS
jgi:monooxygenase